MGDWVSMDSSGPQKSFLGDIYPGSKFWVLAALGPKFKNRQISHKIHNMVACGLAWTPAIILKVIWTLGQNFANKVNKYHTYACFA